MRCADARNATWIGTIWIGSDADGISQIIGSLFTVDAHAWTLA